jgi:2'-5' RNA ligase
MLAVIAVPEFVDEDAVWIDTTRRAHDPQYEFVPAHVTLVFPFDSADPDWFAGHVASVAAVTAPMEVGFDRLARIENPHQPKYRYLNVLLADAASTAPLTALYMALGGQSSESGGGFEPHVTLTRFGAVFSAKALERQMGSLGRPVRGRIAALEMLEIVHGAIRRAQSWPLAG